MKSYFKTASRILLVLFAGHCSMIHAVMENNRYLPLVGVELPRIFKKPSKFYLDGYVMQAKQAFGIDGDPIPLPQLFGKYNLQALNTSMNKQGITNPLYLESWYQDASAMEWDMSGKIQVQGFEFGWEQDFCHYFSLGIRSGLMSCTSEQYFVLSASALKSYRVFVDGVYNQGQDVALNLARLEANDLLGIEPSYWKKTSLQDTELYVRRDLHWDHICKLRSADLGLSLGAILPTAARRDINNPASIPLGSDKFTNFFVRFDGQLELKEDWFLGLWMQFNYSQTKDEMVRVSRGYCIKKDRFDENQLWGVIETEANVAPGMTFGISPFIAIEDFQDGWGAYLRYTLITHDNDVFTFKDQNLINLINNYKLYSLSSWVSEYVSLGIMYNGYRGFMGGEYAPRFYFNVDMPVHMFAAHTNAKTYKFALGFEFNY